jgi:prolipoprotein diacylglyceryltransferase
MYPDLSYFLHDLIGTARDNGFSIVKTFGLFLGMAFFAAGYVIYLELKRAEKEGRMKGQLRTNIIGAGPKWSDVITNAAVGLILGFKLPFIIQHFDEFKVDAAGLIFSSKGNLLFGLLGLFAFGGYVYWTGFRSKLDQPKKGKETVFPSQRVGDIIIVSAISGIFGARLFSILENLDSFWQDPLGQLFSGSGLTVYGGFILGFIVVYFFVKRIGAKPIYIMDMAGMAMMLAYAVGRIGCQLSGDGDWGIANTAPKPSWFVMPDWAWTYSYPHNVLNEGVRMVNCLGNHCNELSPPVFPTPFYETVVCSILFAILWFLRKRIKTPGVLFFLFCIFMGSERFLIEFIRINPRYNYFGFDWSQAQYISVGIFIMGIVAIVLLQKRAVRTTST